MTARLLEFPMARRGDPRSDPDLAAAAAAGDRAAFETLVRRHQGVVRGMARRLAGGADRGDDIAQSAFLAAWTRIETYSGGVFRAWLCAIVYRCFLDAGRKSAARARIAEASRETVEAAAAPVHDTRLDMDQALSALTIEQRTAIVLCLSAGLSHREAAEVTGWPIGTVKSHIQRGKAQLKEALAAYAVA